MTKISTTPILLLILSFFLTQPLMASINSPALVVGGADSNDRAMLTVNNDDGRSWQNSYPDTSKGKFTTTKCSGAICIAAGQPFNLAQPNIPLLYFSNDRGTNWSLVNIPNTPRLTLFLKASCTGEDSEAVCFAAGIGYPDGTLKSKNHFPVLVVTTDGGKTWVMPSLTLAESQGTLEGGSCTGSGANAVCVVVGQYFSGTILKPLILVSKDGGKNWLQNIVPSLPDNIFLNKVSCTGSGNNAICVALGQQWHDGYSSVILASKDSGNTWALKTILGEDTPEITDVSCAGTSPSAVCAVSGYRYDTLQRNNKSTSAMLATSEDNGSNWISKIDPDLHFKGTFTAVSCASSNNSAPFCIAVGQRDDAASAKYALFASVDAGRTWSSQTLPTLSTWTYRLDMHTLDGINCSTLQASVDCMVTGMGNLSQWGKDQGPIRAVAFTTEGLIFSNQWRVNGIWNS